VGTSVVTADAVIASDGPPAPPDAASDAVDVCRSDSDVEEIIAEEDIVSVLEKKEIFKLCGNKSVNVRGQLHSAAAFW
jgi:hypothetical protein